MSGEEHDFRPPATPLDLSSLRKQEYPLLVTRLQGELIGQALDRIMGAVPDYAKPDISADYRELFAALCHPDL